MTDGTPDATTDRTTADGGAPDAEVASRLLRSGAIVGIGTALSRLTGFLRVAAIAYALGVTTFAGVYSYSNETPNIVYELLLGGILTATLVPLFVRHIEQHDERATSALVTVAMLALVVITVIGIVIAPWIVRIYTIRVSGPSRAAQQEVATSLLRLFMPQMLFYGMTALASALLNARRRFAAAAFAPVVNNVVVAILFVALPHLVDGPITLARVRADPGLLVLIGVGTTAGIAAMALVLVPPVLRSGVHLRFLPSWRHPAVTTMLRLSGWTLGYVIANQVALWVVLVLANGKPGGPFAYLSAYAFFQLPHGLLAVSIMTTVGPELASSAARADLAELRARFARALRLLLMLVVPAAGVYVGLARPIVVALLQRGAFSPADAQLVANALVGFAVGLPFFSTYLFTLRAFYALPDTRTPFLVNCLENGVNVVLALALYSAFGIPGLAFAFSGAYAVAALVALGVLERRIGDLDSRRTAGAAARIVAVGAAVALSTWAVARTLGWSTSLGSAITVTVGLVVAAVVTVGGLWLLRVDELHDLRSVLRRR